jgi:2,4-dienoyl-CoA reductase-like NADH-dependent reductase (Old Yellow Enzyme family)/NADPH-dependent 2,4-dienoyl-CoA reductase/sulfur reductase-like enzyme
LHHGGIVAGYSHARWGHPLWVPAYPKPMKGDFTQYFLMEELAAAAGTPQPQLKVVDKADIELVISQFASGARRAREAGFDGIEIHAGHGYLLSAFISPHSNSRDDEYGGSLENRMRLLLEILGAVRGEVGREFPVWVKLDSREEGKDSGIGIDDSIAAARMVEAAGADAITVTTYHENGQAKLHSGSHTPHEEGLNLPYAARIKAALSIPVIASGRVEAALGDATIGKGEADFIAMGRKLLADPHLPRKLAAGDLEAVRPCIYCYTCISAIYHGETVRCAVNPELAHEFEQAKGSTALKHVAVIGGGPGGMEATRRLRAGGHKVTLIERGPRLGGTLRFAGLAYEPNERLLNWLVNEVEASGADIRLATEATPDLLRSLAPDEVIVATGALRGMPEIPGNDLPHVFSGDDMRKLMFGEATPELKRKTSLFTRLATKVGAATGATANLDLVRKATHAWMPLGNHVVIIGGELVGIELAEFLQERGRTVTVVDEAQRFGKGLTLVRRMRILQELEEHGVSLRRGASNIAIGKDAVTFTAEDGAAMSVPADTVVVAKGATGDLSLAESLEAVGFKVHTIGDANGIGYIEGAVRGAYEAVRELMA